MAGETREPTRRERATAERRRRLVLAAAQCFVEKGFHQTSIRDIAAQAGVSLGNLYNHFEGKAALIAEIAELEAEELEPVQAPLVDGRPPEAAVGDFVAGYFRYASRPENAVLAAEITAEAMRNPESAEGFGRNRAQLEQLLAATLESGAESGAFTLHGPAAELAALVIDLAEGTGLRLAFDSRARQREALALLRESVGKLLSGQGVARTGR